MARRRIATLTLLAILGAAALPGCAPLITTGQCVDWVFFETPADAAADADTVVIGTPADRAGSMSLYGQDVSVWRVEVDEWVQGEGDDEIEVVSVPRTCEEGAPYPEGDPLDTDAELMLFLRADGSKWQIVTPFQGAIPAPADGAIPTVWP